MDIRPDYEARALTHPEWVWFWVRRVLLEVRRGRIKVARNDADRMRSCYARFSGQFGQFRSFGRVSVPRWTTKHPHPLA